MIAKRVTPIIAQALSLNENEVNTKDHFTNDLGADDLDMVEIVVETEKEFCITITDAEFQSCLTVQDLIDLVERLIECEKN